MLDDHNKKRIDQLERDVQFWMDECRLKVLVSTSYMSSLSWY